MSELDEYFPRGNDMTAAPAKEDKRNWSEFWPKANAIAGEAGIPRDDYAAFIHDFFHTDSLAKGTDRPIGMMLIELKNGAKDFAKPWLLEQRKKVTAEPPRPAPPTNGNARPAVTTSGPLDEAAIRAKYTAKLSGKEYLQVAGRILLFRLKYPTGFITTEHITIDSDGAVMKAYVGFENTTLGTGYGAALQADSKNYKGRIVEKAETAAIGRALAAAGFGTDEADEGDFLADSPVGK